DFARDLTQRKQIEKEVAMLAQAVRSIHEAVVVTDTKGDIIFVNDAAVKMFGYEPGELIGQTVALLHAANNVEFINEVISAAKTASWDGETLSRRRDGTQFPLYLSASEIHDDNEI